MLDDKRLEEIKERAEKATKGLDCPLVATTIRLWPKKYAGCAGNAESTEETLVAESVKQIKRAGGDRRTHKRPGTKYAGLITSEKLPTPDMRPGGNESNGKTTQSITDRNSGSGSSGWRVVTLRRESFGNYRRPLDLLVFIAKRRLSVDAVRVTQGGLITSFLGRAADTTQSRISLCVADHAMRSSLTTRRIAAPRTDIPDLLAEIERLRGELAARPVLQSRNKSNAIRIGAIESLIPKEKD